LCILRRIFEPLNKYYFVFENFAALSSVSVCEQTAAAGLEACLDLKSWLGGAAGKLPGVSAAWHALAAAVYSCSVVSTSQALSTDSSGAQLSLCGPPEASIQNAAL